MLPAGFPKFVPRRDSEKHERRLLLLGSEARARYAASSPIDCLDAAIQGGRLGPFFVHSKHSGVALEAGGGRAALVVLRDTVDAIMDARFECADADPKLPHFKLAAALVKQNDQLQVRTRARMTMSNHLNSLAEALGATVLLEEWTPRLTAVVLRDIKALRELVLADCDYGFRTQGHFAQRLPQILGEATQASGEARRVLRQRVLSVFRGGSFEALSSDLLLPLPYGAADPNPSRFSLTPQVKDSDTLRDACQQMRAAIDSRVLMVNPQGLQAALKSLEAALAGGNIAKVMSAVAGLCRVSRFNESVIHRLQQLKELAEPALPPPGPPAVPGLSAVQ